MLGKQKLYLRALVSIAFILMLVGIVDAAQFAYIINYGSNNVSVINTTTNNVTTNVTVGTNPYGIAIAPAGLKVYVANQAANTVSVIDTTTNTVTTIVPVGT
jgi:YVTN family beta-propeller protein